MERKDAQTLFKLAIVFGLSYFVFKVITPKPRKSLELGKIEVKEVEVEERDYIMPPPMLSDDEAQQNPLVASAYVALGVYIQNYNDGATTDELDNGVNKELASDLGMKVYRRRTDGKLVVKNLNDQDLVEYDAQAATQQAA